LIERLSAAKFGVARDLVGEVGRLRAEHRIVEDERARLKNLPARPPIKSSGVDKATRPAPRPGTDGQKGARSTRRRGSPWDTSTIGETVVGKANAPEAL
jgi:hypothetical protein